MTKKISIYKSGKFYNTFGDDGVIIHYLMGYKFVSYRNASGFPDSALNKVKNKLQEEKIGYVIKEKDTLIEEFVGINKNYNQVLKSGMKQLTSENRVELLKEKINECSMEQLEKLVDLIENELIQ